MILDSEPLYLSYILGKVNYKCNDETLEENKLVVFFFSKVKVEF